MDATEEFTTPREALLAAIKRAGSQKALAAMVGERVRTGHVYYWLSAGVVPKEHCPLIERGTGVPVEALSPCTRWHRISAEGWPNGKPLIDAAAAEAVEQEP